MRGSAGRWKKKKVWDKGQKGGRCWAPGLVEGSRVHPVPKSRKTQGKGQGRDLEWPPAKGIASSCGCENRPPQKHVAR